MKAVRQSRYEIIPEKQTEILVGAPESSHVTGELHCWMRISAGVFRNQGGTAVCMNRPSVWKGVFLLPGITLKSNLKASSLVRANTHRKVRNNLEEIKMKLGKKNMMLVSLMLFSLFFGAGNLIFPPFLGQMAGSHTPLAMLGFLMTAVVLPVLGVVVVAEFDGLDKLARKVNPHFALFFTIVIYLSIGPGLGIPRAASVPFEMAIAPYLPEDASFKVFMLMYSLVFFLVALWLALTPNKLVSRIGKVLTPSLLILMTGLFLCFLFKGEAAVAPARGDYQNGAFVKGFLEGYNTMDAIAALNFGLVIATTLRSLHVQEKKDVMNYTVRAGLLAGTILALVYVMLSYLGMHTSNVYELQDNGAWTLRCIVHQLFGSTGAVVLAAIFTLACLTTCVGLITSISQYFSTLTSKLSYRQWAVSITLFSFLVCNQGLNTILSISVPVLNMVYPVAIVLIVLGLVHRFYANTSYIFPCTVGAAGLVSVLYALEQMGLSLGFVSSVLSRLPLYSYGMGWVSVAAAGALLAAGLQMLKDSQGKKTEQTAV